MSPIPLSPFDLGLAGLLLLLAGGLSIAFSLGLVRSLTISVLRMIVQLGAAALVLKFVFEQTSLAWTAMVAAIMVAAAGFEVTHRQRLKGMHWWRLLGLSSGLLLAVGLITTLFGVATVIGARPWYAPRYLLPILGMVLGNALTAASLVIATMVESAKRERRSIETRLALGATRANAFAGVTQHALRMGMMPIINAMAVAGIVSLPGMMTGQILAGVDPIEAAKYQVLVMFLIAGATTLCVLGAAWCTVELLTDRRHRLRLDWLAANPRPAPPVKGAEPV